MDSNVSVPNLSWLRSFEAAARLLNFTAAAKELNMTQAALSKQVRLLELYFGEPLFIRKSRTLELTKLGKSYYPKIRDSLNQIAISTDEVFGRRRTAHLTIAVIESFAQSWLLPRIGPFIEQNPDIELRILSSNWVRSGDSEAYDFQINYGSGDSLGLKSIQLTKEALMPVAAPQIAQQFNTPSDFIGQRLIHVLGYQHGWPHWLAHHQVVGDFNAITVDSSHIAYTLSSNGLGIALARQTLVKPYIDDGRLSPLFNEWLAIDDGFYLRYRDAPLSPAASRFLDFIAALL